MTGIDESLKYPIELDLSQNKPILLKEGDLEFIQGAHSLTLNGQICFYWFPVRHIGFEAQGQFFNRWDSNDIHLRLSETEQFDVRVYSYSIGSKSEVRGRLRPIAKDNTKPIDKVFFLLPNFIDIDIIGQKIKNDKNNWLGRMILENDVWKVIIDSLADTKSRIEVLEKSGGFDITHVISVSKNKSEFNAEDVQEVMECLGYFLSFCRGFWTGPILPSVEIPERKLLLTMMGGQRIASFRNIKSWLNQFHPESISSLFPLFYVKWKKPEGKRILKDIIYWYINSNRPHAMIEIGIVLAQAAIELLEGAHVKGMKRLLSKMRISEAIPDDLTGLMIYAKENNLKDYDSSKVLWNVRNDIVHPQRKTKMSNYNQVVYEACELYLWYLELGILKFLDYNGEYCNRLKKNRAPAEVEIVPWAD